MKRGPPESPLQVFELLPGSPSGSSKVQHTEVRLEIPSGQLDGGRGEVLVWDQAQQVMDAVEPGVLLDVGVHDVPGCLLDVRMAEHLVLGT